MGTAGPDAPLGGTVDVAVNQIREVRTAAADGGWWVVAVAGATGLVMPRVGSMAIAVLATPKAYTGAAAGLRQIGLVHP